MMDGNKKIENMSIRDLLRLIASGKLNVLQMDYVNDILNQKRNVAYENFFSLETDKERESWLLENAKELGEIMTKSFEMFLSKEFQDWKKGVDKMNFQELRSESERLKKEIQLGKASENMLNYVEQAIAYLSSSGAIDRNSTDERTGLNGDFSNLKHHTDMYQDWEHLI